MKIRYLTVAGIIAAMVALAGCETDDTWDDDPATTDTWDDQTRTEPERAPPAGTAEQTWQYDPETQQTEPADTGVAGTETTTPQEGTMAQDRQPTDGAADVDMTEFSALDTDATGTLTEEQWVPEAVGGVEFDEVDRDGDGTVTREEFREYFIERPGAGQGTTQ